MKSVISSTVNSKALAALDKYALTALLILRRDTVSFSDDFFKVNPDIKPGTVPSEEGLEGTAPLRRDIPPSKKDKFKETFEKGRPIQDDGANTTVEPKPFSLLKSNKEVFESDVKQAKLNPETNQPRTLIKESKVAPPVGSGKLEAPPEEPRAKPHIEPTPSILANASSEKKLTPHESEYRNQIYANQDSDTHRVLDTDTQTSAPREKVIDPEERTAAPQPANASPLPKTKTIKGATKAALPHTDGEITETSMKHSPAKQSEMPAAEAPALTDEGVETPVTEEVDLRSMEPHPEPRERAVTAIDKTKKRETAKLTAADSPDGRQTQTYAIPNIETAASQIGEQSIQPQMSTQVARQEMIELVNQIVDKLTTVTTQESSEVHITIKNIPLFEGSTIKVTTMKQAPGEFNIEFTNLTQQAKEVLDNIGNRTLLHDSLDQKGYIVHMITTSTFQEESITAQSSSSGNREEKSFDEGDSDQEGGEEKKEEEK